MLTNAWAGRKLRAATGNGRFGSPADSRRLDNPLRSPPSSAPAAVAQQKVFEDKVSLTPRKRGAACAARYVLKSSLRSGLDFDDVIERLAVRASERLERRWPAARHDTPPKAPLIEGRICHVLGSRNFVKRLSYPMFTMFVL